MRGSQFAFRSEFMDRIGMSANATQTWCRRNWKILGRKWDRAVAAQRKNPHVVAILPLMRSVRCSNLRHCGSRAFSHCSGPAVGPAIGLDSPKTVRRAFAFVMAREFMSYLSIGTILKLPGWGKFLIDSTGLDLNLTDQD